MGNRCTTANTFCEKGIWGEGVRQTVRAVTDFCPLFIHMALLTHHSGGEQAVCMLQYGETFLTCCTPAHLKCLSDNPKALDACLSVLLLNFCRSTKSPEIWSVTYTRSKHSLRHYGFFTTLHYIFYISFYVHCAVLIQLKKKTRNLSQFRCIFIVT